MIWRPCVKEAQVFDLELRITARSNEVMLVSEEAANLTKWGLLSLFFV